MHIDTNGPMGARISRNIWTISFLSRIAVFVVILNIAKLWTNAIHVSVNNCCFVVIHDIVEKLWINAADVEQVVETLKNLLRLRTVFILEP